ncbi:MAG: TonB-dependent receptor plug domain-containing protein [Lacinutrix sp.]|uniref:TonB-dependent receptor plug domain-containing protein n=1 Tax=Lacinutrix sp. TaxID=1937692 RepID=UPI003099313E
MNNKNVLGLLCMLASSIAFSQIQENQVKPIDLDEVILSDSRFELKRENSGKTVIKISAKELEQKSGQTVAEIINTKSGITINGQYGQAGNTLSTFVRGGQNRQILVLIDGIAVNDPSQIESNFDLNLLSIDQIESIEILKGASSALYGNRASTAIINIQLKKGGDEKISANFSYFIGTNNAQNDSDFDINNFTNAVGVHGSLEQFNYQVNFSNTFTDGLSAIRSVEGQPENESDVFSKYSTNAKLGYTFSDNFNLSGYANYDNYRTGFDGGFTLADENSISSNKQYRFGIAPKYKYKKGSVNVNAAINTVEREFESGFPAKFYAQSLVVDAFNKYKISYNFFTVLGVNYVKSDMNNTDDFTTISEQTANDENIDAYANATYLAEFGLNINAGLRLNNHSEYGSNMVYNLNPSYVLKLKDNTIKLMSSYSTAYITPSLYQLFVPGFGNANLEAQKDRTIEAGFEAKVLKDKLRFSGLYFNRAQKNAIDFVILDFVTFESEYQNIDNEFTVNGVEVELTYKPIEALVFNANYTFTENNDAAILRVPKQKVNASLGYQMCDKTFMSLDFQFTGERTSAAFEPDFIDRRTLESFSLVNFNINHKVLDNKLQLFAGVSNLLDEDCEEVYRFSTRGRNYRFGFKLNL